MKKFKSKEEVFDYIIKTFKDKYAEAIFIKGSTAHGKIKHFSDIDLEIITKKTRKPYYELALLKDKIFLISAYFYWRGKSVKVPKNVKVLYGGYSSDVTLNRC